MPLRKGLKSEQFAPALRGTDMSSRYLPYLTCCRSIQSIRKLTTNAYLECVRDFSLHFTRRIAAMAPNIPERNLELRGQIGIATANDLLSDSMVVDAWTNVGHLQS